MVMSARDPKKEIVVALNQLVHVGALDPETVVAVSKIVTGEIDAWRESIASELQQKIIDWEATMAESGQNNFYSLGLRRAIDVVTGQVAYDSLPILEKPDTPDEQESPSD
jgi:hypothetical protein